MSCMPIWPAYFGSSRSVQRLGCWGDGSNVGVDRDPEQDQVGRHEAVLRVDEVADARHDVPQVGHRTRQVGAEAVGRRQRPHRLIAERDQVGDGMAGAGFGVDALENIRTVALDDVDRRPRVELLPARRARAAPTLACPEWHTRRPSLPTAAWQPRRLTRPAAPRRARRCTKRFTGKEYYRSIVLLAKASGKETAT